MVKVVEFLVAGGILGVAWSLVKKDSIESSDVLVLHEIFEECHLRNSKGEVAEVIRVVEHNSFKEFYVKIPLGKSSKDLEKCLGAIETYFNNQASIEYGKNGVNLKLYTTRLKEFYAYRTCKVDKSKGLSVVLGMGRGGVVIRSLSVDPHLSIIGSTGGGKSVLVNSVLCQLIENYTSEELELVLLDLKGNELNEYRGLQHTKFHANDVEESIRYMASLKSEMVNRYKTLGNYRDISAYNKAHRDNPMKYQFIVIEECYSLIGNKKVWALLGNILSKARACGMHFLFTTQRPTADVIPSAVTTHLGIRVGLKVNKAQESRNAIEMEGLERLVNVGSGIVNFSGRFEYFQGFYISSNEVERISNKYRCVDKGEKQVDQRPSLLYEGD